MRKSFLRSLALAAVLSLTVVTVSSAVGGSIGQGNISVYKDGQLSTTLKGQNPIEEGSLLSCDGGCIIKSEGISLMASDKSKFSITNEETVFNLTMEEGRVDYVLGNNSRKIAFHTPRSGYTVGKAVVTSNEMPVVKGYITVAADGETEISVTEGQMIFATADGMTTVDQNNTLALAVAPPETGTVAAATTGTSLVGVVTPPTFLASVAGVNSATDGGTTTPATTTTSDTTTSTPDTTTPSPSSTPASPST